MFCQNPSNGLQFASLITNKNLCPKETHKEQCVQALFKRIGYFLTFHCCFLAKNDEKLDGPQRVNLRPSKTHTSLFRYVDLLQ